MTKYTANIIGTAKSSFGSGAWDLFDQGELVRNNRWGSASIGNTGGNVLNGNVESVGGITYKYHTFTQPGTFIVGTATTFDILVIGGGGPGAYPSTPGTYSPGNWGGGGGAGGVVYASGIPLSNGTYNITVGLGGSSLANGQNSVIYSEALAQNILIAIGGGVGAMFPSVPASPGGSGGGGRDGVDSGLGGVGIQTSTPQFYLTPKNEGNPGRPAGPLSGGGGGAGLQNPINSQGTNGIQITPNYLDFYGSTIGLPALNPLIGTYGGGGGGSFQAPPPIGPASIPTFAPYVNGGGGGGGKGSFLRPWYNIPGPQGPFPSFPAYLQQSTNAIQNTGGGGGGGGGSPISTGDPTPFDPLRFGSNGANGLVVIRYVQ